MSERINVAELRRNITISEPVTVNVRGDVVLELVEAVQAAHEVVVSPKQIVDDRLVDALARFDFGDAS